MSVAEYKQQSEVNPLSLSGSVIPPPTKLTELGKVELPHMCTTVSTYQGSTYVGVDIEPDNRLRECGEIIRIGTDSKVNSFAEFDGTIYGLAIDGSMMYTTSGVSPQVVSVHDLNTGKLVRSWNHSETVQYYSNNLAIVGGENVVIADRSNKRLSVYTLTGQIIKQIPCQKLQGANMAMCAADNDSVIVSDYHSDSVYRISITTGRVLWEYRHFQRFEGVTCYNNQYVLAVMRGEKLKIQILDLKTGE